MKYILLFFTPFILLGDTPTQVPETLQEVHSRQIITVLAAQRDAALAQLKVLQVEKEYTLWLVQTKKILNLPDPCVINPDQSITCPTTPSPK